MVICIVLCQCTILCLWECTGTGQCILPSEPDKFFVLALTGFEPPILGLEQSNYRLQLTGQRVSPLDHRDNPKKGCSNGQY